MTVYEVINQSNLDLGAAAVALRDAVRNLDELIGRTVREGGEGREALIARAMLIAETANLLDEIVSAYDEEVSE